MLAQPPDVGLVAGKTGAMNTALLSGTDADGLTVLDIAHGIALGVFQGDQTDDEVALGLVGKCLVLCGDMLKQGRVVELHLVASLFKGDAEHLLAFNGGRHIVRVDLDDIIGALALVVQYLQGLGGIVGCNDAIAHLTLDECGRGCIAGVAQCHKVAVAAHAVGATGTGIGASQGRKLDLHIVNEIYLLQGVAQWKSYGSTGWRYMLETGCCGETRGGFEFLDKLPAVERVKEVDITGASVQDLDGKFSFFHENS